MSKREDIINTAIEEFSSYYYDAASINSIIENSSTSKGTFYYYFRNKEALYIELIKESKNMKEKLSQQREEEVVNNNTTSIFQIIKRRIKASIDFGIEYPKHSKFLINVANEPNTKIKLKVKDLFGDSDDDHLKEVIKNSIYNNKIRENLPEDFICSLMSYQTTCFTEFLLSSGISLDSSNIGIINQYLEYYIDFLEKGLGTSSQKVKIIKDITYL
ncbi:TetR/AcrR family transcriptional regulator [Alkaliphilus pronyensis]|uniref:TetR/AcrR family transcriptional regulator n=1 Tax=Alkaliphilus pronyensis TaxID=1482732 RepID=A0A6I0F1V9_9FIRM|nr:TetR/AcrR family transcriptional regulator [Alkaliphilus pronyensis]KAB3530771.1 TetR/AcrR family transcriptional regulator [Alkaliphilus pronyensis]